MQCPWQLWVLLGFDTLWVVGKGYNSSGLVHFIQCALTVTPLLTWCSVTGGSWSAMQYMVVLDHDGQPLPVSDIRDAQDDIYAMLALQTGLHAAYSWPADSEG